MISRYDDREKWNQSIVDTADYFTVVRFLGRGRYERHERKSLNAARGLAKELAKREQKNYLIYAVSGIHDTYVESVKPE